MVFLNEYKALYLQPVVSLTNYKYNDYSIANKILIQIVQWKDLTLIRRIICTTSCIYLYLTIIFQSYLLTYLFSQSILDLIVYSQHRKIMFSYFSIKVSFIDILRDISQQITIYIHDITIFIGTIQDILLQCTFDDEDENCQLMLPINSFYDNSWKISKNPEGGE